MIAMAMSTSGFNHQRCRGAEIRPFRVRVERVCCFRRVLLFCFFRLGDFVRVLRWSVGRRFPRLFCWLERLLLFMGALYNCCTKTKIVLTLHDPL